MVSLWKDHIQLSGERKVNRNVNEQVKDIKGLLFFFFFNKAVCIFWRIEWKDVGKIRLVSEMFRQMWE